MKIAPCGVARDTGSPHVTSNDPQPASRIGKPTDHITSFDNMLRSKWRETRLEIFRSILFTMQVYVFFIPQF